jgi:uncharacterized protein YkwD
MAQHQTRRARLRIEQLEDRTPMAAHLSITLNALQGVIDVEGTRGRDVVRISFARGDRVRVSMSGPAHRNALFHRALVRKVVFHGNGGRDRVVNRTNLPVERADPPRLDTGPAPAAGAAGLSAAEVRVLQATNAARASRGLPALVVNPLLQQAAHQRAVTEAATGTYLGDGGFPQDVNSTGYPWTVLGENDGYNWGYADPARQLTVQWWDSPPHRANILDPGYAEVGVGVGTGGSGTTYGVVIFGRAT